MAKAVTTAGGKKGAATGAKPTHKKGGMPPFVPTTEQRINVKMMVGFGIPQERICSGITNPRTGRPISKETLEVAFEAEIISGSIEMDRLAMTALALKVQQGNLTAIIWYMKNRMGWRDVQDVRNQQLNANGEPIDPVAVADREIPPIHIHFSPRPDPEIPKE